MWPWRGRTGWLTATNVEYGQTRKFGRYPFRSVQEPLPDWSTQSRQARRSYLFHAGDPLHSSGHPHGALRRTSLACASEASPKVPADRLGSGTGSPRFQRSIYLACRFLAKIECCDVSIVYQEASAPCLCHVFLYVSKGGNSFIWSSAWYGAMHNPPS